MPLRLLRFAIWHRVDDGGGRTGEIDVTGGR